MTGFAKSQSHQALMLMFFGLSSRVPWVLCKPTVAITQGLDAGDAFKACFLLLSVLAASYSTPVGGVFGSIYGLERNCHVSVPALRLLESRRVLCFAAAAAL